MKEHLHKAWVSRSPRDRALMLALVAIIGLMLYVWLVRSGGQARLHLRSVVTTLKVQAVRLDWQAMEYRRLRAMPPATASSTDLLPLVQERVNVAGLARALVRIDAPDTDQVVVVFGAVTFADWLDWIASLKTQRVRLDACRIEALSTPGLVSVTATLVRAKVQ